MNQKKFKLLAYTLLILSVSCVDIDINPLATGTSSTWYTDVTEMEMSLNDLNKSDFWPKDDDKFTDDITARDDIFDVQKAAITSQYAPAISLWDIQYKAIARANNVINNIDKLDGSGVSQEVKNRLLGEALFFRATSYFKLITKFGDVPYSDGAMTIEEGLSVGRTDINEVKALSYVDIDQAIDYLPVSYNGVNRVTKGAALAFKARYALYLGDFDIAAKAAKDCMDLNVYSLHPDYGDYFRETTKKSPESIYYMARSVELNNYLIVEGAPSSRNAGGFANNAGSWDLFASYLCTDGLTVDKSPLFDPKNPFENRDPRCSETLVPFGSEHMGFIYDPHPDALEVLNVRTGNMVANQDCRAVNQYASYHALLWKKGWSEDWYKSLKIAPDDVRMRYAEVLLIYAEANIELNKIDQSVLDAMNSVRSRAYKTTKENVAEYPSITTTDQKELRKLLRNERRMEFAYEGLRYMDVIRWRIAGSVYTRKSYGIFLDEALIDRNSWFWPMAPIIDENGNPDFSNIEATGKINVLGQRTWHDRQYLYPIPEKEIIINKNIKQNDGY